MHWRPQREVEEYEPRHEIYELVDPLTKKTRYVGQGLDSDARLRSHLKGSHNPAVEQWIFELRKQGLDPQKRVLQQCRNFLDADQAEKEWIARRINECHPLLNRTPGGHGGKQSKISTSSPAEWVHSTYCMKYARDALLNAASVVGRSLPKSHSFPKRLVREADKIQNLLWELESTLEAEMPGWLHPWQVANGTSSEHFEAAESMAPDRVLPQINPPNPTTEGTIQ